MVPGLPERRGGEYKLGERQIRELFCNRGLSLVFLNACESGGGGRADFNELDFSAPYTTRAIFAATAV